MVSIDRLALKDAEAVGSETSESIYIVPTGEKHMVQNVILAGDGGVGPFDLLLKENSNFHEVDTGIAGNSSTRKKYGFVLNEGESLEWYNTAGGPMTHPTTIITGAKL